MSAPQYFMTLLKQLKKENHLEIGEAYIDKFKVLTKNAYDELSHAHMIKSKLFTNGHIYKIFISLVRNDEEHEKTLNHKQTSN